MVSGHNLALSGVTDLTGLLDLDHAATAPLAAVARAAMEPFLDNARHGNPSGSHPIARDAVRAVDEAREVVAECIGCRPDEVVFTSGGTEADNHAVAGGMPPRSGVPLCSAAEHHAVLEPTLLLGGSTIGVDALGRVVPGAVADMVNQIQGDGGSVGVVSVMSANNDLGTMNDIASIAGELRSAASGVPLHTDAVQAAPWLDLSDVVGEADLVSVSSHKLGGPKGTGALVVRRGVELAPLLVGGSQEHGMRAGTTDVAGVVGFAAAFRETVGERAVRSARVAELRDRLADLILDGVDGVVETVGPRVAAGLGLPADRTHLLPGHLHLTVEHANSEELLLLLEAGGVCASAASSCASGAVGASHVLAAIGADRPGAAALRLSLGPELTPDHLDQVFMAIRDAVGRLRAVPGGPKQ